MCTAAWNESRKVCHISVSPEKVGKFSLGKQLTGSLVGGVGVNTVAASSREHVDRQLVCTHCLTMLIYSIMVSCISSDSRMSVCRSVPVCNAVSICVLNCCIFSYELIVSCDWLV